MPVYDPGASAPPGLSVEEGWQRTDPWTICWPQIHGSVLYIMAIVVCPWSWRKPATWARVYCPQDRRPLARNGRYARTVWDRTGAHEVVVQRYWCARCQRTYSALPWDLQPHRSVSRPSLWAVWGWRVRRHWPWARIEAWCLARFPLTRRTLQRWVATVITELASRGRRLLQAVATRQGGMPAAVWVALGPDAWATWRQLWRVWGRTASGAASTGSWLQVSAVAGWLSAHTS